MVVKGNCYILVRRLLAAGSFLALTAVFFVPSAARWFGFLPRLQLVPALFAGAVLELVVLALSVLLFGRLYCSIVCPLGILQDLVRFCLGKVSPPVTRRVGAPTGLCVLRYLVLLLFLLAIPFGSVGLFEPYGIFGRFLAAGVRRVGEPATVTIVWSLGLVVLILILSFFRARFWCNRICPVGTFLGLFSRFALFRVRIDPSACVKCGACVKRCDKGALSLRADKSIAVDHSSCIACGTCLAACPKGALSPETSTFPGERHAIRKLALGA